MGPTVTFLTSIGLCLIWMTRAQMGTLPRPTLWAVPSPVVSKGANVTLRCQGHLGSDRFQLWMDRELREERNESWELEEFVLINVDDMRDARSYSCRSGQRSFWSEHSDPLTLVVIGEFPSPSISSPWYYKINPGTKVTIQCQWSVEDCNIALLEAKSLQPLSLLEPLQLHSPRRFWAEFSLKFVRAEDTGSYSCLYYKKTAPHVGSKPSDALQLKVNEPLPKPTLWAQAGVVMAPGANITLWCSRPKLFALEEVTFILEKVGTQKFLQRKTSADLWTSFLLLSVKPEDTGSYICAYREKTSSTGGSEASDALELVVPGSLPRPSLSVFPGLMVEPGTHVTLQCQLPPWSSLWRVTFMLMKVGTLQPLQSQNTPGTSADFPLFSVRAQDAGNYSCAYQERMNAIQVSEPSNTVEILVTDALPKPSLSAWPGPEVASGVDVTLQCWGPSWSSNFVLYKEGVEKILPSMNITQYGARFFLSRVTPSHSGKYICTYQLSPNGSLWKQNSDPLQLIVRDSELSNTLIIILSCVSFILLLLCLLLLAFLCHGSILMRSLQGYSSRSTCSPHHSEASREESLYTEVDKETHKEPSVPISEDPQTMTYTQLNIRTLNMRKTDPKESPIEPTLYATVSLD
ncbi:immunoglobulin superfamily member 1-like isoform X2 [Macrotis lagotis]|uniref:immunoglobulin superfamily member 1-like isoform X2 n=1 Tax=Macrotis lagotis TaxID=92651 RepID=UPI003D69D3F9